MLSARQLFRWGLRTRVSYLSMSLPRYQPFSVDYVNHRNTPENNENIPFEFTSENYKEIEKILKKYPSNYKRSAVIPLLTMAQKQNDNFLTLNAMKKVAKVLEMPELDVFEVATFYSMFNRVKVGKYHLQICGTTPCELRGAPEIIATCEKHLGVKKGETTPDGLFTIQEVECLGACANAPMIQVNGEWVYEDLTPENTVALLDTFAKGEKPKVGPQINRNNAEGPQGRTSLKTIPDEILFDRDFAKAKQEWQAAKEEAAKKAAAQQQAGKK